MGAEQSAEGEDVSLSPVSDARALRMQAESLYREAGNDGRTTRGGLCKLLEQSAVRDRLKEQLGFKSFDWGRVEERLGEGDGDKEMPIHEWRGLWVDVVGPLGQERMFSDKLFAEIDADGDGSLTREEVREYLKQKPERTKALSEELGWDDWEKLFKELDADESGTIDATEFAVLWSQARVSKKRVKPAPKLASVVKGVMFGGKVAVKPAPKVDRRESEVAALADVMALQAQYPYMLEGALRVSGGPEQLSIDQRRKLRPALRKDVASLHGIGEDKVVIESLARDTLTAKYRVFGDEAELKASREKAVTTLAAGGALLPAAAGALAEPGMDVAAPSPRGDGKEEGSGELKVDCARSKLSAPRPTKVGASKGSLEGSTMTMQELQREMDQLESSRKRAHLKVPVAVPSLALGRVRAMARSPSPGLGTARTAPGSPPPMSTYRSLDASPRLAPDTGRLSPRVDTGRVSPAAQELGHNIGSMVAHTLDLERGRLVAEAFAERDRLQHDLDATRKQVDILVDEGEKLRELHAVELTAKLRETQAVEEALELERASREELTMDVSQLREELAALKAATAAEKKRVAAETEERLQHAAAAQALAESEAKLQKEGCERARQQAQQSGEDAAKWEQKASEFKEQLGEEREKVGAMAGELKQLRARVADLDAALAAELEKDHTEEVRQELTRTKSELDTARSASQEMEATSRSASTARDHWKERAEHSEAAVKTLEAAANDATIAHQTQTSVLLQRVSVLQDELTKAAMEKAKLEGKLEASDAAARVEREEALARTLEASAVEEEAGAEAANLRKEFATAQRQLREQVEETGRLEAKLVEAEAATERARGMHAEVG
eukprot:Hpha_TRINITY_DN16234_c1_g7::TRINITY_DN16234_c1_g7_i1::g.13429::m.13429